MKQNLIEFSLLQDKITKLLVAKHVVKTEIMASIGHYEKNSEMHRKKVL